MKGVNENTYIKTVNNDSSDSLTTGLITVRCGATWTEVARAVPDNMIAETLLTCTEALVVTRALPSEPGGLSLQYCTILYNIVLTGYFKGDIVSRGYLS